MPAAGKAAGTVAALALLPVLLVRRSTLLATMLGWMPVLSLMEVIQFWPKMVEGLRLVRLKLSQTQLTATPAGMLLGGLQGAAVTL